MINTLIISHSLIPSVLLCGHSQLEYLKSINKVDYKFIEADKVTRGLLSWADIIIFLRSESKFESYISTICKLAKKHMVYILDDDLLNIPDYLSSSAYYRRKDIHNNMLRIMNNCDTFLTSSFVMLEKYGKQFKHAYQIDEPSLNVIDDKKDNERLKIGFAGSIDRAQDINIILESCLEKVINNYSDTVDIEFMGAKPDIVDKYNLTYIPYQDSYEKYTKVIQDRNWDIGLAPMPDSEFHSCKYYNKYVEYASFGIAGIYSNLKPYTYGIKNEYNGLLTDNTSDDWYKSISKLIEDSTLRKTIQNNCLNEAKTRYSLPVLAEDYLNKITDGLDISEPRKEVRGLWIYRIRTVLSQIKYKLKEQKLNFPIWAIKKIKELLSK